jgi:fatty-acyl-CoA synthase
VTEHCEGRIAGYKKPRSVVIAKELPISPVGKIQRREVKETYGAAVPPAAASG